MAITAYVVFWQLLARHQELSPMSSTTEEIDGNENITSDLEEKDLGTKYREREEVVLVNGGECTEHENLNGGEHHELVGDSLIHGSPNLSLPLNGIKRETDQELKFIVAEYEQTKRELSKLQSEYKLSLQRERSLSEKLQDYHAKEDSSVADLNRINGDLRSNLDRVLDELKCAREELKR